MNAVWDHFGIVIISKVKTSELPRNQTKGKIKTQNPKDKTITYTWKKETQTTGLW